MKSRPSLDHEKLKQLRRRSLPAFFGLLLCDWAIIVLAFVAAAHFDHPFVYVLSWFVLGTRQHALGVLGHEGTHGLIHKNQRLNHWIARVFCFWPIFMPYEGYSPWHIEHHRWMGTDKDTEDSVKHGDRFVLPTRFSRLVLTFFGDLIGLGLRSMALQMTVIRPPTLRAVAKTYAGPVIGWTIATLLFVSADLAWIPLLWFAALPTSFWAVFRVREFFEHTGIAGAYRYHLGPIGRFCFCPNFIWVHYEHHKWPFIPCYRLLEARKLDTSVPVLTVRQLIRHMEQPDYEGIKMTRRNPPGAWTPALASSLQIPR
jgi:fatty acid desaturase